MKSDVIFEQSYEGVQTQEKFASKPGLYCGLILLVDIQTAEPVAIINDGYLQHLRVAADAAIGVRALARADAATLGVLGSGGMARSFAEAIARVRPIRCINVFSPTRANRERYAHEVATQLGIEVVAVDDAAAAARGADILASCTDSAEPVVRAAWLEPGMHVVSVGGRPHDDAIARFDIRLRFGTATEPFGHPELRTPASFVAYLAAPDHDVWRTTRTGGRAADEVTAIEDVSLADVLAGRGGRTSAEQITYSERGNLQGLQFFAVAGAAYDAARARGIGRALPTEWFLQDIRD